MPFGRRGNHLPISASQYCWEYFRLTVLPFEYRALRSPPAFPSHMHQKIIAWKSHKRLSIRTTIDFTIWMTCPTTPLSNMIPSRLLPHSFHGIPMLHDLRGRRWLKSGGTSSFWVPFCMGVSQKWMVYHGKPWKTLFRYISMDDLGEQPLC